MPMPDEPSAPIRAPPTAPAVDAAPAAASGGFHNLLVSALFSGLGQWVQQAVIGWIAYDLTGSGTTLGLVNGVRAVPQLILAPIAGTVVDLVDRRRILVCGELFLLLASGVLAAAVGRGTLAVWHLVLFSFATGLATALGQPARQALVHDLVPRRDLPRAVSLLTAAGSVARAAGPAAAGALIAWVGPAWCLVAKGGSHLAVVLALLPIRAVSRGVGRRGAFGRYVIEGLRYIATEPDVRLVVTAMLVAPLLLIPSFGPLMPMFARDSFDAGPEGLGVLLSAIGVGGLAGAGVAGALSQVRRRGAISLAALLVFCGAIVAFALAPSMWWAVPALIVAGAAEMVATTMNQTMLQLAAPDALRGRVMSAVLLTPALISVGALVAGVGADILGAQTYVIGTAMLALLLTLLLLFGTSRLRQIGMR